jgi:hypothetical protein
MDDNAIGMYAFDGHFLQFIKSAITSLHIKIFYIFKKKNEADYKDNGLKSIIAVLTVRFCET